jgi:hypothetical protein
MLSLPEMEMETRMKVNLEKGGRVRVLTSSRGTGALQFFPMVRPVPNMALPHRSFLEAVMAIYFDRAEHPVPTLAFRRACEA